MADETLAARIRAKYPGVYDDLDDATLEQKVRAKYPGVYDDIPSSKRTVPSPPAAPSGPTAREAVVDTLRQQSQVGLGALKGAANTAVGLGEFFYRNVPVVNALSNLTQRALYGDVQPAGPMFAAARQEVQPTTPAQQLGYTTEQLGEFFVPATRAARLPRVAEALKAGALTLAQTGEPTTAGVSAGISAVVPGGRQAQRVAGALERSAQKSVVGALAPTKEWAKEEATVLAPQMLARGVRGTRAQMLEQARTMVKGTGAKIGTEIQAAAATGQTIPGGTVTQYIQTARDALMTPTAAGTMIPIAGTEPVIRKLDGLSAFVGRLPADIPIDQAAKIKTIWDHIVSKAGLYGPKAQASATESATAWSIREAATSFRDLIAKGNPTLDDLNREYAFWKGLRKVLGETERRTQAHGIGLTAGVTSGAGLIGGLTGGEDVQDKLQNALTYGVLGGGLVRILQSPYWATRIEAPLKQALADALASGSTARVTSVVQRMSAALPAQVSR